MSEPQSPNFEVRCHSCDVSFPVGTKECVHCGERIGRPTFFGREIEAIETESGEMPALEPMDPADQEEPQRGRGLRLGVTALWLIAALLSALVRACQDG